MLDTLFKIATIVWVIVLILFVNMSVVIAISIKRKLIKADKKRYILVFVGIVLMCIAFFVNYNLVKKYANF